MLSPGTVVGGRYRLEERIVRPGCFGSQLFNVGCTANADIAAELFGADDALTTYATPSRFGS